MEQDKYILTSAHAPPAAHTCGHTLKEAGVEWGKGRGRQLEVQNDGGARWEDWPQ